MKEIKYYCPCGGIFRNHSVSGEMPELNEHGAGVWVEQPHAADCDVDRLDDPRVKVEVTDA